MRILVINPFADTEFRGRENLEKIKRPDTKFDMVQIAESYPLTNNQWLYFRHLCTDATIDKVIQAEKDGYDAVFISCNLDIGLYEARSLVNIPVTAMRMPERKSITLWRLWGVVPAQTRQ